jgi:hypothetical protein
MTSLDILAAILAGFGLIFIAILVLGVLRGIAQYRWEAAREKRYAAQWMARHPSAAPVARRQGGE